MSVLSRWQSKLFERKKLEASARERHVTHPTTATRAQLNKRKAQVAYAARVVKRHATSDVRVLGNTVTGGTPRERLKAAAEHAAYLSATGQRHSFYSQSGVWTASKGIMGEPHGYRSDCSQWFTSMYHSCGLDDPNGNLYRGGFTGTLADHGRRTFAPQCGDAVLIGTYPYHHVEMLINPKTGATIGHGSAPVDASNVAYYSPCSYYTFV
jgi:hypothetical protein